jgi:hypothetical protein
MEGVTGKRVSVVGRTEQNIDNVYLQLKVVNRKGMVRRRRMGSYLRASFYRQCNRIFLVRPSRNIRSALTTPRGLRYFKAP